MGFLSFLEVALMPIIEVLIISILGAFMGTGYCNLLPADARKSLNKIVFMVFTPSLMFASLVKTVTLDDIISWWFMPVNIGLTFFFGGILGWILVKITKPEPYLKGLVISMSASGNLGNLLLIMVHAICREKGSPFGDREVCRTVGLSYASFSMAVRPFREDDGNFILMSPRPIPPAAKPTFTDKAKIILYDIVEEIKAPPTVAADECGRKQLQFAGLVFGAIGWLKHLLVGEQAPLRVIQSSCITLILGGNLMQGTCHRHWRCSSSEFIRTAAFRPVISVYPLDTVHSASSELKILRQGSETSVDF